MESTQITAKEINELRQQTGAGIMDCRKALIESNGDLEKAIDYLRKKGQKVATQRSDRDAKEGSVIALTSQDKKNALVLCLSCETDFVAKNDEFISFANELANLALDNQVSSVEQLKEKSLKDGVKVSEKLLDYMAKIGEKIDISKLFFTQAEGVVSYIHGQNRMGVIVAYNIAINSENELKLKDIAMQIAAMNPVAIDENSVSKEIIDREMAIILEQMKQDPKMEGKPDEMLQKIAQGKLNAYFKEQTLLAQVFVKDPSKTVKEYLQSIDSSVKVISFNRVALG